MSLLSDTLYRTNTSVLAACELLGIDFDIEDLEDLEQCNICSCWYPSYELVQDVNDMDTCKFCTSYFKL